MPTEVHDLRGLLFYSQKVHPLPCYTYRMSSPKPTRTHMIYTVAVIGFIYTLHLVIPMYSNSSFLSLFADEKTLGFIYMAGAAITVLGYLTVPHLIRRFGNYVTILWLIVAQMILFYELIASNNAAILAIVFALQSAVIAMIGLCMDVFLEVYTDRETIGTTRGLYTATLNASWVIGPLIGSLLINGTNNYRNTYVAGLAMLFPLLYLVFKNFPRFKDPNYMHLTPWQLVKHVSHNVNWSWLFLANLILQVFYAWMVVYSPLYLSRTVGFSWESIGIILTVMLLPFPLIQYPLGRLADKRYGEKEIMALGFVVMAVSTISLAYIDSASVWLWALGLFMTRVGAASAEIMMETYFFKTVSARDTAALGLFRVTRPLAYFIAPLVTGFGMMFTTDRYIFVIIGVISLIALIPAFAIRDTN